MKYLWLSLCLWLCTTCVHLPSPRPLCKEEILSQYATFVNAGYETEIIHLENYDPVAAYGFKYHIAVRVKVDNKWFWVEQPAIRYVLTKNQPTNTRILKKMELEQVIKWIKH